MTRILFVCLLIMLGGAIKTETWQSTYPHSQEVFVVRFFKHIFIDVFLEKIIDQN
jgi:hypothetical protein